MDLNQIPDWVNSAKAGDKVVCILSPTISDLGVLSPVRKGDVRTIRQLDDLGFALKVFIRTDDTVLGEVCWFNSVFFRPLTTKSTETGMKKIRKLLDSVPVKEDA